MDQEIIVSLRSSKIETYKFHITAKSAEVWFEMIREMFKKSKYKRQLVYLELAQTNFDYRNHKGSLNCYYFSFILYARPRIVHPLC